MELKCKDMKELVWQTCLKRNQIMKKNSYKKNNTSQQIASVCYNTLGFKKKSYSRQSIC